MRWDARDEGGGERGGLRKRATHATAAAGPRFPTKASRATCRISDLRK